MSAELSYFGGANSAQGFVSYYQPITEDVERLYILKGGCGCGKNSLMRRVAIEAMERGERAERVYCASDTDSLDGVILRERGVGVIDGTAPHELSPRIAGAMDNLVDLGEYWDADILREQKEEIKRLDSLKKGCYRQAYSLLAAANSLRTQRRFLTDSALLADKLQSAAERIAKRLGRKGQQFVAALRPRYAFCGKGTVTAKGYEGGSLWAVKDSFGIADRFYAMLLAACKSHSLAVTVSPDATDTGRIGSLLLTTGGVLFAEGDEESADRVVNMERFVDKNALGSMRQRLRFLQKTENALKSAAVSALAEAREHHKRLEDIYIPAMDFDRVNTRTEKLIKKIFA